MFQKIVSKFKLSKILTIALLGIMILSVLTGCDALEGLGFEPESLDRATTSESTIGDFFMVYLRVTGPKIGWILALILADVVFAVAVALLLKKFELTKLSDFLRTNIIPKVIGFVALDFLLYLSAVLPSGFLPEGVLPVSSVSIFAAVVLSLLGSIMSSIKTLGLEQMPEGASSLLTRIGVKTK